MPLTTEQRKERTVKSYLPEPLKQRMDRARRVDESRSAFVKEAVRNEIARRLQEKGGTTFAQRP